MPDALNKLYYGDNLQVLRDYIADQSVDLVYLDPPFNSRQDYNVLFAEKDGNRSAAQITAFKDTWEWNLESQAAYEEIVERGGRVADAMRAFKTLLGNTDMMAYLAMMAPRLVELRRVLKDTGSIYLHCDPTASHYLKLIMDAVFGPQFFQNEIIWKRTFAHGGAQRWGDVHDTILFFTRSSTFQWNRILQEYEQTYLDAKYRFSDERGTYRLVVLTGPGATGGASGKEWRGYDPSKSGRHWAVPKKALQMLSEEGLDVPENLHDQLDFLYENGLIRFPEKKDGSSGVPEFKLYLPEGQPIQDIITDIPPINSQAKERLGYPTQKPEALLERILRASSKDGDLVLDPFCGCGTTVQVAQRLNRRWIGIDITHLAVGLIKTRLDDSYGSDIRKTYEVIGEPTDVEGARQLAEENKFQFQAWALGLVGARVADSNRRGADRGIDGRLYFHEATGGDSKQIIFSVKGGHNISVAEIRDLIGVLQREKAEIGVYISFEEPTGPMRKEAAEAGFYTSADSSKYPHVQLLTIKDLIEGNKSVQRPLHVRDVTFKKAPRNRPEPSKTLRLQLEGAEEID